MCMPLVLRLRLSKRKKPITSKVRWFGCGFSSQQASWLPHQAPFWMYGWREARPSLQLTWVHDPRSPQGSLYFSAFIKKNFTIAWLMGPTEPTLLASRGTKCLWGHQLHLDFDGHNSRVRKLKWVCVSWRQIAGEAKKICNVDV